MATDLQEEQVDEITRLTRIFTDEVSLVDIPANEREFLVRKQKDLNFKKGGRNMPEETDVGTEEVTPTPAEGDATETQKGDSTFPEGAEVIILEAEKSEDGGGDKTETQKVDDVVPPDTTEKPKNAMEAVSKAITFLGEVEGVTDVPEAATVAVGKATGLLNRIKSRGAPPKPEAVEIVKATEVETEKAGAKISQARLSKLKAAGEAMGKAAGTISELVKEFEGPEKVEAKKGIEVVAAPEATPAPAPVIPAPPATPEIDVGAVVSKAIGDAMKPVTDLVEDLKGRVAKVEDHRPASKSLDPEDVETQKAVEPFWGGLITGDAE